MPIVSSQVWIPFLSLVGGGLAGAILTGIFANVRARKQPVGYAKEMTTVFKSSEGLPNTYIAVKDGEDEGKFNNLFIVNVVVVNKGNRDMDRFTLGLTSYEDDIFVRVNPKTPDRHHVAKYEPDVSLLQPTTQVDFTLEPFNRQDAYVLERHAATVPPPTRSCTQ